MCLSGVIKPKMVHPVIKFKNNSVHDLNNIVKSMSEANVFGGRANSADQTDLLFIFFFQSEVERSSADLFPQLSEARLDRKDERSESSSSYYKD